LVLGTWRHHVVVAVAVAVAVDVAVAVAVAVAVDVVDVAGDHRADRSGICNRL